MRFPLSSAWLTAALMLTRPAVAEQTSATAASSERPLELAVVTPIVACQVLSSIDISLEVGALARITFAEVVSDGKVAPYCDVKVLVDDYAKLELHLPVSTWTQRLLFGGGMAPQDHSMLGEFVTASWQDLGNRGHEEVFATNYQYRVDFAYRAMHLQVIAAKAITARYFGRAPRFSYYNACSEPAREGMMEVQRFPDDFDGVAAGCPPLEETVNHGIFWSWNVLTNTGSDGQPIITADKLPILHKAVLAQCDASDGARDGVISNPFSCSPDLHTVECKPGSDPAGCLTPAQIHAAQEIYRGAHDAEGRMLEPRGALPGSELAWTQVIVASAANQAWRKTELAIRYLLSDPALPDSFKLADLKFDYATFDSITKLHFLYDATDTDLRKFAKAGHKVLMWQGLADATVLPVYAAVYFSALQKQMGAAAVDDFARLYLLPGVNHCGGGDGPAIRDLLSPLMSWVERGVAPGALNSSHVPSESQTRSGSRPVADLSRPVYPYPYTTKYVGIGSFRDASSFVEGPAREVPIAEWSTWYGENFYRAGVLKWCAGNGSRLECRDSP